MPCSAAVVSPNPAPPTTPGPGRHAPRHVGGVVAAVAACRVRAGRPALRVGVGGGPPGQCAGAGSHTEPAAKTAAAEVRMPVVDRHPPARPGPVPPPRHPVAGRRGAASTARSAGSSPSEVATARSRPSSPSRASTVPQVQLHTGGGELLGHGRHDVRVDGPGQQLPAGSTRWVWTPRRQLRRGGQPGRCRPEHDGATRRAGRGPAADRLVDHSTPSSSAPGSELGSRAGPSVSTRASYRAAPRRPRSACGPWGRGPGPARSAARPRRRRGSAIPSWPRPRGGVG